MNAFDLSIVSYFNQMGQYSWLFNKFVYFLDDNLQLTIVPIISMLWWSWFKDKDQDRRRELVVSTLIGCIFAGVLFYFLRETQLFFGFRPRPLCNPEIHFQIPYGIDPSIRSWCLDATTTFPSGHAALLFALSSGLTYISRSMGIGCLIYSFLLCLPRIFLGNHYPTDVIGGALIGVGVVYLANAGFMRNSVTQRIMKWAKHHPPSFYVAFFILSFNIATYFGDLRQIIIAFFKFLKVLPSLF